MKSIAFCLLSLLLTIAPASADDAAIAIKHAWARPTASGAVNGAAYFTIENAGKADDVLTGAKTAIAAKSELHESLMENGVMIMRPLGDVVVPAAGSVDFKPGGKHLMLLGLKSPLTAGQTFTVTLQFKNAGPQEITIAVANNAPDSGAANAPMHDMNMPGMDMHH